MKLISFAETKKGNGRKKRKKNQKRGIKKHKNGNNKEKEQKQEKEKRKMKLDYEHPEKWTDEERAWYLKQYDKYVFGIDYDDEEEGSDEGENEGN